jgi:hypothetical protein
MTRKIEYAVIHKLSKFLCAILNTFLFTLIFDIEHYILFFIINLTYFFGVNSIGFLLEEVLHLKHKHDLI